MRTRLRAIQKAKIPKRKKERTKMVKERARRKLEIAVDKLIDFQQDYKEAPKYALAIQEALDRINQIISKFL